MGKKQKRQQQRADRFQQKLEKTLETVKIRCLCGNIVDILPLNTSAYCSCGKSVSRW
jgi:hypothetical protein